MTRASRLDPVFDTLRERLLAMPGLAESAATGPSDPSSSSGASAQTPGPAGARVIALMSRVGGEGVTTVAVGLARSLARVGSQRTLLIDHDSSRHGAAARLGVSPRAFAGWPAQDSASALIDAVVDIEPGRLGLLNLGHDLPSGFANDRWWAPAYAALRQCHGLVLVDTGSMRQPLALRWARLADLRLLVLDTGRTTTEELERLKVEWQTSGQTLDAVVLSKRDYPVPGFLYRHVR